MDVPTSDRLWRTNYKVRLENNQQQEKLPESVFCCIDYEHNLQHNSPFPLLPKKVVSFYCKLAGFYKLSDASEI